MKGRRFTIEPEKRGPGAAVAWAMGLGFVLAALATEVSLGALTF
ncbi:hypothetical protein [Methylocystis sp. ATCC 49242]|nr:hypothetical protein [Methylocystis sp. ATCC 49242]